MITAAARAASLDDLTYASLNELLERRFGLHFPEHRRAILENRLQTRLRAHGFASFPLYCEWLREHEREELEQLANAVTNHETYFFRERAQFDALFGPGMAVLRPAGSPSRALRILSAACATGEEAYSIAFAASELAVDVDIDAFDLDYASVDTAQRGVCRRSSLRALNDGQIERYLETDEDGAQIVRKRFRNNIRFAYGNLVDLDSFRRPLSYDVVFCRNALIYFSPASLRRAVENLCAVLRPGGLLFLGHAESVIGMFSELKTIRLGDCMVYRRAP